MQLKNYEIGDCIAQGEVSTYRAVSLMTSQVVYVHVLPAEPSRLDYWMSRIRELQNNLSISPCLEVSGDRGRHCLISHESPGFTGFAEWLAAAVTAAGGDRTGNEADSFFRKEVSATELLVRAAPPPKKKRDYQPPQPAAPSEYSRLFIPPKVAEPEPPPE